MCMWSILAISAETHFSIIELSSNPDKTIASTFVQIPLGIVWIHFFSPCYGLKSTLVSLALVGKQSWRRITLYSKLVGYGASNSIFVIVLKYLFWAAVIRDHVSLLMFPSSNHEVSYIVLFGLHYLSLKTMSLDDDGVIMAFHRILLFIICEFHKFFWKDGVFLYCFLCSFEFKIGLLLDLQSPKVREISLTCYLNHNWWEEEKIHSHI